MIVSPGLASLSPSVRADLIFRGARSASDELLWSAALGHRHCLAAWTHLRPELPACQAEKAMTLVAATIQGKRAYLYGDRAWVDDRTGVMVADETKLFVGQRFPFVVGSSMTGAHAIDLCHAITKLDVKNVRSLIAALPLALQEFQRRTSDKPNAGLRLVVACWDARLQKPRILAATTMLDGLEAWGPTGSVVEFESYFGLTQSPSELLGRVCDPRDPKSFDPDEGAVAIFEAARRQPVRNAITGLEYHGIGGGIDQAVVTKRGVTTYGLQDWPDEVGKPIAA